MALDSYPPKTHTRRTQTSFGSGVHYGVNNAIFHDTSRFSTGESASGANKYGVFQEEIPWLDDAIQFYTDIHALCAHNCLEVCGICILRNKVDLKVQQLLKLCEFNTPRVSENDVENGEDPLLRNSNITKRENLSSHRRSRSKGEKKKLKSLARACSDDCKRLKVSNSFRDKLDTENEQKPKETVEGPKTNSNKIRKKNCWYFLHSKCKFGAQCKFNHDERAAKRHYDMNMISSSETDKDGKKKQILDTVQPKVSFTEPKVNSPLRHFIILAILFSALNIMAFLFLDR